MARRLISEKNDNMGKVKYVDNCLLLQLFKHFKFIIFTTIRSHSTHVNTSNLSSQLPRSLPRSTSATHPYPLNPHSVVGGGQSPNPYIYPYHLCIYPPPFPASGQQVSLFPCPYQTVHLDHSIRLHSWYEKILTILEYNI